MKQIAVLMLATVVTLAVLQIAGCRKDASEPQPARPPSTAEAPSEEAPPQDFVQVDQQPELLRKVEPVYPELAKKSGMEGMVWVKIWVDTSGKAREVTVLKSDAEIFNQPTIDAAKQFEFKPARIKEKPVSVWVSVPFKYKLADKPNGQAGKTPAKPASPEEVSFMKGYVAAKEELLRDLESGAASARENGRPNAELEQKIQKLKADLTVLREALRAMQSAK